MAITSLSDAEIVQALEKNESRQFTEAAHAELMRRQKNAYESAGRKMFWLTVIIGLLALSNLIVGILNFLKN